MSSARRAAAIDANVILRFLSRDQEELFAKSQAILEAVEGGRAQVECDPVTLAEVVWVLGSFYRLPRQEVAAVLQPLLSLPGFLMPHKDGYLHALRLFGDTVSHFGDACACACALDGCEGRLYSFDRQLSAVEGVDRRETVAKAGEAEAEAGR